MKTTQAPYSSFLRGPSRVLPSLEDADVVLERRDEDNLVLTTFRRFAAREEGAALAGRLIADVIEVNPSMMDDLLVGEFPWLRWLPDVEQVKALKDIIGELLAGATAGSLEPFVRAIDEWRDTAVIWSDPSLAERLQGSFAGSGDAIERPGVTI
ncbi:MAG: hypothetical protein ACYDB2_07515 [Acidimicrobiales bacterium]